MKESYKIETFGLLRRYIVADLYRYMTSDSIRAFLRGWFIPGFRFSFYLRTCQWMILSKWRLLLTPANLICRLILRHYQFKYGISIHPLTSIGPGLYIGHFGEIIVNPAAKIGTNCNLSPGTLIGQNWNKERKTFEYPSIGNEVYLGNNSKIIGGVNVGDNAVIAVSSVVTKDVSANTAVAGIPAKILTNGGGISATLMGSFHPWTKQYYEQEENPDN